MPLVLLIEDHHDIAAMVCDHLEYRGYEVDYEPYFVLQPGLKPHGHKVSVPGCGM